METSQNMDYSIIDRPEVLMALFHPRPDTGTVGSAGAGLDLLIPVEEDIRVGARFHIRDNTCPNILFFHGNGEIVSDYDDLGPMYNQLGINFLPVDYRGYGRSNGEPSVAGMMKDCHTIFTFVRQWLQENGHNGPLIVMGRSLGSASALELAWAHKTDMDALVIESGFALAAPLLRLLGVNAEAIGFSEENGFRNIDKIQAFEKPTLIIHAEYDHIIPFSDGQSLYDASPAPDKKLIRIPGANHNDILFRGLSEYMDGIQKLVGRLAHV
jgi:pimeloyl-ACP methyl ester carboxylesterase